MSQSHQPRFALLAAAALASWSLSAEQKPGLATNPSALAIGETFTLQSEVVGEVRRINVYAPPVAGSPQDVPRPVLYMPDGGIAEDFLHIAGLLQVSVGNATMRPFLLVGIENTERRRDMTGPTEVAGDRKIAPRVGGSAAFRRFIRTELIPVINERYHTTSERAIVGESLAGLFAVETFLLEPALFDTYIAFDPSLWWNDEHLLKTAPERLRILGRRPITLFLASSRDNGDATARFAALLGAHAPKTVRWRHEAMPAESHATIYHPAAVKAFRHLFAPK